MNFDRRPSYYTDAETLSDASEYGLDATDDYSPRLRFTTSSVRDEPFHRPPVGAPRHDPLGVLKPDIDNRPPLLAPEYEKYMEQSCSEVRLGLREDGVVLHKHPYVGAFIQRLPHTSVADAMSARRGISNVQYAVDEVLGIELDRVLSESIFVLAALHILAAHNHPAHLTLWRKQVASSTAQRVQKIMDMTPRPIVSPIAWNGFKEEKPRLRSAHEKLFSRARLVATTSTAPPPAVPPPEAVRRRKAPALTRRKSHRPAKPVSGDDKTDLEVGDVDVDIEDERPLKRSRTNDLEAAETLLDLKAVDTTFSKTMNFMAPSMSQSSSCTVSVGDASPSSSQPSSGASTPNVSGNVSDAESTATCVADAPAGKGAKGAATSLRRSPRGKTVEKTADSEELVDVEEVSPRAGRARASTIKPPAPKKGAEVAASAPPKRSTRSASKTAVATAPTSSRQ